jgi:hypothetical protein
VRYQSLAAALQDPDLFASSALLILVDQFGTEAMDWEPETLNTELADKFGIEPSRALMDKLNAALALLTTELFYKSLEAFTTVCMALSSGVVSSRTFNMADLDDVMWGVTEARLLEGKEVFDAADWSHDIARYVGVLLSQEGIARPPKILNFAEQDPREVEERDLILAADLMMAEAYWRRNDEAAGELEQVAMAKLDQLFQQVESLPLANKAKAREAVSKRVS